MPDGMSAMASSSEATGLRSFSGDSEDAKEYKRWKTWVSNKILTLSDKMPKEARGAYVYTLLSGKALECVEHLEPEAYQRADGETVLFKLLDQRFPQKDSSDEMSEILTEVFNLRVQEGETLKAWISRASEVFEKCSRRANVSFPEEARGWLILHRSGLSEEQKAVCLARSLGVLKRDEIGRAMRSCYPEFAAKKNRSVPVHLLEMDDQLSESQESRDNTDPILDEVEQFLAEHDFSLTNPVEQDEAYDEHDVAEALAVTWKEKRRELTKLQRSRKFTQADQLKRSFRVDVEELKKKSRCRICNQLCHWARECKSAGAKGSGKHGSSTTKASPSGAAFILCSYG